MESGKLRHLVTIESRTGTRDPQTGEAIKSWTTFAQAWASADPLSARELIKVREFSSEITTKFVIRHLSGLDNTMRLIWNEVPYEIAEVIQPKGDRRSLEILAYAQQTES